MESKIQVPFIIKYAYSCTVQRHFFRLSRRETAVGISQISIATKPGRQQHIWCYSRATQQEETNSTVRPLPDSDSIIESVGNFIHYGITATPQIPDSHQHWNIRPDSRIFSPGPACAWLSSATTTLFSGVLCASKFCPCRENFLAQWHNHVGTQSTHVECCSRDTCLLEVQFPPVTSLGASLSVSRLWR